MPKLLFTNKILMLGFGGVAQATLPILFKHIDVPMANVTVMDFEEKRAMMKEWTDKGVHYVQDKITKPRMEVVLSTYIGQGDLLIDLAWNIGTEDIINWCHNHGVLYINTSTELWDPYTNAAKKHPTEHTLYFRHMSLRCMTAKWKTKGPSAVIEHGANPGLVSHFVKQGLIDIAEQMMKDKKVTPTKANQLTKLIAEHKFNELSATLGIKVIHIAERDTQISNQPKQVNEFVNTWSIEGLREEITTTAELGWGTHEKETPFLTYEHKEGPKNQICLARMGINVSVASWVPDYPIHGMIVRHGEAFTLSDYLTVWDGKKAMYRPTVHYAYCPSDATIASLHELKSRDFILQDKLRIMKDDIISGEDILGALIMGHPYKSWWVGSNLSIEQSRRLVPHQNATVVQVAISVVAACMWMIENPNEGLRTPESLPHDYVLRIAKPYLGQWISKAEDWTPLKRYQNDFIGFNKPEIDEADVWQFKNFLLKNDE